MNKIHDIKEMRDFIDSSFHEPSGYVYHYSNNIQDIVTSHSLIMSSHHFLNEKNKNNYECVIGMNLIFDNFIKRMNIMEANIAVEFLSQHIIYYSSSFTCLRDDSMISVYGGESIAIDSQMLKSFSYKDCASIFCKVEYEYDAQIKIVSSFFDRFYDDYFATGDHDKMTAFMMWLSLIIPLFKVHNDKKYNECRVVLAKVSPLFESSPHISLSM